MKPFTTLRAGGLADLFGVAKSCDELADAVSLAQRSGESFTLLGWGSNILPSDAGVRGVTLVNSATSIRVARSGEVIADSGCEFQTLFLKTAQAGLSGLQFAVGIPGTLGGALVSNAGAYRSNISEFITEVEVVHGGGRREWVTPEWMQFSYRDSILRRSDSPSVAVLRVRLKLSKSEPKRIYDEAREYQRQRISKQPPSPSAGSFFKNVNDGALAESLENLPRSLKAAGVVPAGYLIEAAGLKGFRLGGAMLGKRHANFILNVGNASSTEIRLLARFAQSKVQDKFGVQLEEEVLYIGDWSAFPS